MQKRSVSAVIGLLLVVVAFVVCGWLSSSSFIFMAVFGVRSASEAFGLLLGSTFWYLFGIPFFIGGIILLRHARRQNAYASSAGMACLVIALCLALTWAPFSALELLGLYTDGWARAKALDKGILMFSTSATLIGIIFGIMAFYFFRQSQRGLNSPAAYSP